MTFTGFSLALRCAIVIFHFFFLRLKNDNTDLTAPRNTTIAVCVGRLVFIIIASRNKYKITSRFKNKQLLRTVGFESIQQIQNMLKRTLFSFF